jgi:NitT/TauT family transport system permease protein
MMIIDNSKITGRVWSVREPDSRPKLALTLDRLGPAALAVVVLIVWQLSSNVLFVVPSPVTSVQALAANFSDSKYMVDLRVTAIGTLLAFVYGAGIAFLLGLVIGLSSWARALFEPLLIAFNGIPKIVLYPVLLQIFSLSGSKIAMGALFAFFPVFINVATGIREMPAVYWKLAKTTQASRWNILIYIILPAIRKPLLTGVRLSVSLAMSGVVLSEFFATDRGLGRVVLQSFSQANYPNMVATLLVLLAASFIFSMALWHWEKRLR